MSRPDNLECLELETRSRFSKFAFIPVLRGKTSSAVSNRIAKALQDSNFCSNNPLIKKLIVQNVQICCIVVETSGTQSIRVICATVPYLLSLLARANPKFKQLMEDEKVKEYFKFFQEADVESLLTSFCAATVIIQKGIKMCYPTLCIQLSRDALHFGETNLKGLLTMFYKGLEYAFHFVWEDLGPAFYQLCAENRSTVKYIAKKLPVYALAGAKGLILFSFLVRKIVHAALKTFKRSVISLCSMLRESSIDTTVNDVFENVQRFLKHITTLVISGSIYQLCKYYSVSIAKWCAIYAKDMLPLIQIKVLGAFKSSAPVLKKYIRSALQSVAKFLSPDGGLVHFIKLCYNSKPALLQFLKYLKMHAHKIYQYLLLVWQTVSDIGSFIYPYCKSITSSLLRILINCFTSLIRCSSTVGYTIRNFLLALRKSCPTARDALYRALKLLDFVFKLLSDFSRIALHYIYLCFSKLEDRSLNIRNEIFPCLSPTVRELNSTAASASNEVIQKSFDGVKRVVPSLWGAVRVVTPVTFYATQEILLSSKNSAIFIYPVLLDAAGTVRPELFRGMLVVLRDVNNAVIEVVSVYGSASHHLGKAAANASCQLPVVLKAANEVSVVTYYAVVEIVSSSFAARARVTKDLKRSACLVNSSIRAAELELLETLDEIAPSGALDVLKVLYKESTILMGKTSIICGLFLLKMFHNAIIFNVNCIFSVRSSPSSNDTLKLNLKNHLDRILNVVTLFFKKFYHYMLRCDNLKYSFLALTRVMFSVVCDIEKYLDQCMCSLCCEILHNVIPKLWNFSKYSVSIFWQSLCESSNSSWELLELMSSKIWCFVCNNFPEVWEVTKNCCHSSWDLVCKVSPNIWNYMQSASPTLWHYNRQLVLSAWSLHLHTSSHTWNVLVPLTSDTWAYAVDSGPKMWVAMSENSKSRWDLFCYLAEQSWETVFETSFSSLELFQKIIAKIWRFGIRPVTVSACHGTSSVLSKSIKLSQSACSKTGKIMIFLSDGLTGTVVLLPSKLEERAVATGGDILKKCIDFSKAKLNKPNSKRMLMLNSMKKMVAVPSQISDRYSNYLTLDHFKSSIVNVSKIPLMPISHMCNF
ncbi:hypothetical protein AVEN_32472-1 [Araneus ventricosus]|uniref:Uncharacterized protein n=1 Tax=Araneus ventricosus TaxID=182803 RepID=A0A4Y2ERZ9_ARAVE|nr:hypothetical protein AVEN_32472-1 [Araneus ventricosus]